MKRIPIPERQRRISEGLRIAWKRRKREQRIKATNLYYRASLVNGT